MRAAPINQAINCIQIEFHSARALAATLSVYIIIAGWQAHKNAPDARKKTSILDLGVYDLFPFALSALNFECKSAADDYLQNAVKGATERASELADSCSGAAL
jgi:hypothetical protein